MLNKNFYLDVGNEAEVFGLCFQKKLPLMIKGPTGCGKSQFVSAMAERLGRPLPRFAGGSASTRRGFAAPPDRVIGNANIKSALGWGPQYPSFREGYAAILSA